MARAPRARLPERPHQIVAKLIAARRVNQAMNNGTTPLNIAAEGARDRQLLAANADLDQANNDGARR